ncbi:MAG: BolA/IbaG family iron-sulfur metabolism protein [Lentisphaeria bacterium]|jgi:acid stress-induced BolA-like protein IbaG/YrbA|nr:BolA/IbaG family iron-sulfur metabolism protein [Lentisphaeria bacterium]MDP7740944.1 BolA/IbaG family iron-sulfur metabolism protein [Lentisphaeria bacterium]
MQEDIERLIQEAVPDATVIIKMNDGVHLNAIVISAAFEGVPPVKQHRMVMAPLKSAFGNDTLHALALKTYTPEKWANR